MWLATSGAPSTRGALSKLTFISLLWRRQLLMSMVAGRAISSKPALYRIKLIRAKIQMFHAQRPNGGSHNPLTVHVNLHPEPDAEPAHLEHTAPKGRAAYGRL